MKVLILVGISSLLLAGCSINNFNSPDAPRLEPKVVQYKPGMEIPTNKPHIEAKTGNINSMYDPVVHCHTLSYPISDSRKVCRIVK